MSTIITRIGKGTPLTNAEVDANFTNLNTDKVEAADTRTLTNKTINLTSNTLVATSAQIAAAVTDETGTGALVFAGSPALTGTPTAPTAAAGTNTTQVATTAHVFAERSNTATLTNKTLTSPTVNTATISGGTINNTVIGGTTRAAGSFTTLDANGNVVLGDATADTISANGRFNTDVVPSTTDARDLGTSTLQWKQVYATTFTEGAFPVVTQTDIGTAPNQLPLNQYLGNLAYQNADAIAGDLRAGSINNTPIGATTASTGAFTTLTSSSDATLHGLTVGRGAGAVSTNTAVGASALVANTSGDTNTATGFQALTTNTSGASNTAYGVQALRFNTTGGANAAFGRGSLNANTTGGNNVAVGENALTSNTTASNNTAVGYQAGFSNTTGFGNVTIGSLAGYSGTTAQYQTVVGFGALQTSTGSNNTAIGIFALNAATTATNNTAIGPGAGSEITTGSKNTILGGFNGNGFGLDIRTSNNNIVLSDGDSNPVSGRRMIDITVGTSVVALTPHMGVYTVAQLAFVTAYNLATGAQGWFLVACDAASVGLTVISSNNGTGLTVNFSRVNSGTVAQIGMATTSGSVLASVHWVS